ncbi:MAG TPA: hypothetical protein DHW07_05320 [Gammaproteobacteria bacterium]|nr:hypothetical protein [Gammaproteobacteria bacterium]|tara:strand:- start:7 stop:186 length:180 start_codon:yes stop_codon:yes gene_type:complete
MRDLEALLGNGDSIAVLMPLDHGLTGLDALVAPAVFRAVEADVEPAKRHFMIFYISVHI